MAVFTAIRAKHAGVGSWASNLTPASSLTRFVATSSFAFKGDPSNSDPLRTSLRISFSSSSLLHSALRIRTPFSVNLSHSSSLIHLGKSVSRSMRRKGGAMSSHCSLSLSNDALRWVLTASAASLILLRNNGIYKQLLVPFLALQLPHEVVVWCRGEYGLWTAFLAILVRLFYHIPGDLELPLVLLILLITSPFQAAQLRGTQAGIVISCMLASYAAFQHFSTAGSAQEALNRQNVVTTVGVILVVTIPLVFLFRGL